MSRVSVVIGAGISGLTTALELEKGGRDVRVFDAAPRTGGCIQTRREDGYVFENGPNSFPDTARELFWLADAVGVSERLVPSEAAAATRLLYHRRRLMPVPMGPKALMSSQIFTPLEKVRVLMERFVPRGKKDKNESVAQFFCRRFGVAPARTLVDAFVSGIYAGDARRIGLRSAFPMLYEMEQKHGSILKAMMARKRDHRPSAMTLYTFRGGFADLMEAMVGKLRRPVELKTRVRSLKRAGARYHLVVERDGHTEELDADEVVIAAPAAAAGLLLSKVDSMAADLLFDVDYAAIITLQAAFEESELPSLPIAFGFLAPRPQRMRTLGWLFTSRIFPGRAPAGHHALTGYIGGATDEAIMHAPHDAIRHVVLGELSLALRLKRIPVPERFNLVEHDPGLPQHDVGHYRRMAAVQALLAQYAGLAIVGNYVGGISLNDCVKTARSVAAALLGGAPASQEMSAS